MRPDFPLACAGRHALGQGGNVVKARLPHRAAIIDVRSKSYQNAMTRRTLQRARVSGSECLTGVAAPCVCGEG